MAYEEGRGGYGGRGPPGRGPGGPRQMYDAKCSTCGAATQVPFQPTEGRPVYCREHYQPKPRRF